MLMHSFKITKNVGLLVCRAYMHCDMNAGKGALTRIIIRYDLLTKNKTVESFSKKELE